MSFFYMQICVPSKKIVFSFIHEKKFYRKTPINKNFKKLNFKWLTPFHVLEHRSRDYNVPVTNEKKEIL